MSSGCGMAGWLMGVALTLGLGMNANAGLFGLGGTSWKEEVLLHDGSKIVVERKVKRGGGMKLVSSHPTKNKASRSPFLVRLRKSFGKTLLARMSEAPTFCRCCWTSGTALLIWWYR